MDIRLPQLAEGADSGTVVNILVAVGDRITQNQPLLELENQKAVAPIPSPAAGVVSRIHVKNGDLVTAGQVLVTLSQGEAASMEEASADGKPKPEKSTPAAGTTLPGVKTVAPSGSVAGVAPVAAPSVRRLARQLGIDLAQIPGSQRGGRVTLEDLKGYVAGRRAAPSAAEPIDFSQWGPVTRKPLSALRATIGRAMADSWSTIPHVTQFGEADITHLLELKKRYGPLYQKRNVSLTVTSFILRAVATLLTKHPMLNASLDEAARELVLKDYVHLGIAVDTPAGLIVPVLRDADRKGLLTLSKELKDLAERARQRKVNLAQLQGASFSISNQGGIGGTYFTPIIHKPEVAVLGVGQGQQRPVFSRGKVVARTLLPLSLSYDHRVLDGADAARFMRDLTGALEQFPEAQVKEEFHGADSG